LRFESKKKLILFLGNLEKLDILELLLKLFKLIVQKKTKKKYKKHSLSNSIKQQQRN